MVKSLKVNLNDLYIEKKLHHDTLVKILGDNNPLVLFRMYCIANEIKERQELFEIDNKDYFMLSSITTKPSLKGEAREQAKVVKMKGLEKSPYYKIRIIITEKKTNIDVFSFEYKTSKKEAVYNLIPRLETKINNLLCKRD